MGVMFDVIAVIEEEQIIDPPIMADRATGVLEVAMKAAQS